MANSQRSFVIPVVALLLAGAVLWFGAHHQKSRGPKQGTATPASTTEPSNSAPATDTPPPAKPAPGTFAG